jgi:DNA-binding MarR family transcriptional regulator
MEPDALNPSVTEFVQAVGHLTRRLRATAASQELSLSQASVLARLEREGTVSISDLARAEGIKPQSMGATVAALEERGLVERRPHPTDGRQFTIALTGMGESVRAERKTIKHAWITDAISQLSGDERETLFAATPIVKKLAEL